MAWSPYTELTRAEWARLRADTTLTLTPEDLLRLQGLNERRLMGRKGFPESYDVSALIGFLADIKAGRAPVSCPVYSHLTYDIVPGEALVIDRPDVVILEGLNVLQMAPDARRDPLVFVSDFFDCSIYVDAAEHDARRWYIERFLLLRATAFKESASYFHRYAALSDEAAEQVAGEIWDAINGPNLRENILPTRERAHLVLVKGADHAVGRIQMRKL